MRISREELLNLLLSVEPGLSSKNQYEQSGSFVFKAGDVVTYNNEVSCRCSTGLEGMEELEIAVPAKPLISMLQQYPDDDVEIEFTDELMVIRGKRKRTKIKTDKELSLLEFIDKIEKPKKWVEMPDDFSDALALVQECASNDNAKFKLTCIHIHPKWVEAADNYRGARYRLRTGVKTPTLVKRKSIRNIINMGMTELSETENWVHFRNAKGLIYSCRRYMDVGEYHDLSAFYKVVGEPVTLPKGLEDAAKRSEILSSEDEDHNIVQVELKNGKLKITGKGVSGEHTEFQTVAYHGRELSFIVFPKLLMEVVKRHTECVVSEEKLMVDGGRWRYATILNKPESMQAEAPEED